MKQPIKMTPGDDTHLSLLMAPYSLNLCAGQERQHLLGYGRAAFEAGLKTTAAAQCLHQIQEPASVSNATSQAAPAAVAVPDFENWRKREYPWLGPIGDGVQIAREAWSTSSQSVHIVRTSINETRPSSSTVVQRKRRLRRMVPNIVGAAVALIPPPARRFPADAKAALNLDL